MRGPVFMAARYHRWFLISTGFLSFFFPSSHSDAFKYVYMHYLTHCRTQRGTGRERKWPCFRVRPYAKGSMNINNNLALSF